MNAAAFILTLAGAGLSLFQPVIPFIGASIVDFLTVNDSNLKSVATAVVIIAVVLRGFAMSMWMKTVLIWGLCYISASFCAYMDEEPGHDNSSKLSTQSESVSAPSLSKPKDFEPVLGVETPALIKRAFLFLSDDDFDEAEHYFEQALRQDPENSQAYLGKLMAVMKVHNIDELSRVSSSLSEDKLFKHAVEFANDEEKAALQKCLEANINDLSK